MIFRSFTTSAIWKTLFLKDSHYVIFSSLLQNTLIFQSMLLNILGYEY